MARVFFSRATGGRRSPNGTVIMDMQGALAAHTGNAITIDGIFGNQTTTALRAFQAEAGLTVTGTVTEDTWSALMNSPAPSIFERSLQLVASFEGTGFQDAVGNFDGAGLTWGIVGFTLGNGELGRLLREINATYPAIFASAFGGDAKTILEKSDPGLSPETRIAWGTSVSRGKKLYRLAEPWKTYFRDLGAHREVQKIQIAWARGKYWSIALKDAERLGMSDELDLCLMFDVAVQNGGLGSSTSSRFKRCRDAIAAAGQISAEKRRRIVAEVVAATSKKEYQADVLSRKLLIATGDGTAHGDPYHVADWGLIDGVVAPVP